MGAVEKPLAIKPSGVTVRGGEKIVIESPGAGGYGPPAERSPEALATDLESGKFSADYLRRYYPKRGSP
jgi:N-methylhydantoinase B